MGEPDPSSAAGLDQRLRDVRRDLARRSPATFARIYLGNHFSLEPSRMHVDVLGMLERASRTRNSRIAVAAPRGHAKSTIVSLAYVLWSLVYGLEPFIVLISNTGDQGADLLAAVKNELESNALLLGDFPEATEPPDARPGPERWRRTEIITRNGMRVITLGAGQKVRGRKHREHRPSLIILDDVENEQEAQSADLRESKLEWFHKSVMKAGNTDKTNVVVVGTILHFDSLVARLLREPGVGEVIPGWTTAKYKAVIQWSERTDLWEKWAAIYAHREEHEGFAGPEAARAYFDAHEAEMLEGTEVLWPEREGYYSLMELRLREGEAAFDSEKQNEPVDPKSCFFDASRFVFWDDQYATVDDLLADLGSSSEIYGACDPSLGRQGRNRDDTAIVTLMRHTPTGTLYVLDADIKRRPPHDTISAILEYHRMRKFEEFAIETNQFQAFLASELHRASLEEGVFLRLHEINHTSDKLGRIQSLEPLITNGFLRFSRKHRVLLDELRQFPKGAHDDGPDALEMAVVLSRRQRRPLIRWIDLNDLAVFAN